MNVLQTIFKHNVIKSDNHIRSPKKLKDKISQKWNRGLGDDCQQFLNVKQIKRSLKKEGWSLLYTSIVGLFLASAMVSWALINQNSLAALFFGFVWGSPSLFIMYLSSTRFFSSPNMIKDTCIHQLLPKIYKEQFNILSLEDLKEIKEKNGFIKMTIKTSKNY